MSVEEAKRRVKELNQKNFRDQKKINETARRVAEIAIVNSIHLPQDLVEQFHDHIAEKSFGSETHIKKLQSHWRTCQKIIKDIDVDPREFEKRKEKFYRHFINNEFSLDYSQKLLRIINLWGAFICEHRGQFFKPIPYPEGQIREKINDSYADSEGYIGASEPLTPSLLEKLQPKLEHLPGQWEWLYTSLWLGLRPSEIPGEDRDVKWRVSEAKGKKILEIYQSKLTSIERDKRWKLIPIIYPEQEKALEYFESGDLIKPLNKTIQGHSGKKITSYAGRKGFTDLMLDLGQELVNISMWLGHQKIDMTLAHYKDKKRVHFKEIT